MKTLLIYFLTLLLTTVYFRTSWFDSLDITSDNSDISWDEITEDLWP
ncbi:hypothetical protein [Spirosoma sp. KNUC1025]|nr:hypothetical protein LN737_17305 [Spirosoma sp. KNUC1025]